MSVCACACVCISYMNILTFQLAEKLLKDREFGLFTVILFKKAVDELKLHCRENE